MGHEPGWPPVRRSDVIEQTHGRWSIRIFDDQPIAEGNKYAADRRVVVAHRGAIENEFTYPSYRIWTLLAHWADDLS